MWSTLSLEDIDKLEDSTNGSLLEASQHEKKKESRFLHALLYRTCSVKCKIVVVSVFYHFILFLFPNIKNAKMCFLSFVPMFYSYKSESEYLIHADTDQ